MGFLSLAPFPFRCLLVALSRAIEDEYLLGSVRIYSVLAKRRVAALWSARICYSSFLFTLCQALRPALVTLVTAIIINVMAMRLSTRVQYRIHKSTEQTRLVFSC